MSSSEDKQKKSKQETETACQQIKYQCYNESLISILPIDVHLYIFELLGYRDRAGLIAICPVWNYLISRKLKLIVPIEGLQLWLCSDLGIKKDGHKVTSWRSEIGSICLLPSLSTPTGQHGRDVKGAESPVYMKDAKNGRSGVFFDYAHTASLTKELTLRTICSVHSFEFDGRLDHKTVHGYEGELSNFYIFTDTYSYPMHGGGRTDPNNLSTICSHPSFRNGTLKVNGDSPKRVCESSKWIDTGPEIAILTLGGPIHGLKRIGADRRCHHYCGTICELLVYDKELTPSELSKVEAYLKQKYLPKPIEADDS